MIRPAPAVQPEPAAGAAAGSGWTLDSLPPELEFFRTSEAYRVELADFFAGPLDLLLYLIQKEKVDIYDIPIARITDQFIQHIEVIQTISLDQAGEFIAMAATLLVIKMRMLMPSRLDADPEEEDPRAELVRRLLEYKRFKEAAEVFQQKEQDRRQYHLRQTPFPYLADLDLEPRLRIEMFDLLAALAGVLSRVTATQAHAVVREPFTVDEKMSLIDELIGAGGLVAFTDLFSRDTIKMEVIVTFIAVLEMVKRGRLEFLQTQPRGPIWIQRPGVLGAVGGAVELAALDEAHAARDDAPAGRPDPQAMESEN